jgi:hypothetical protein
MPSSSNASNVLRFKRYIGKRVRTGDKVVATQDDEHKRCAKGKQMWTEVLLMDEGVCNV